METKEEILEKYFGIDDYFGNPEKILGYIYEAMQEYADQEINKVLANLNNIPNTLIKVKT